MSSYEKGTLQWYRSMIFGSACEIQLSEEEDMDISQKSLVCAERKEDKLTKLLPKSMKSFQGELKKMRLEMGSAKEVESRAESRFAHGEYEHAAALHDAHHSQVPRAILRWMGGGKMPKRRTLSDLLQEYESQTERFRDHTDFQEFCKIQVEKSK